MFAPKGCEEQAQLLIVGASNQWFATTLAVLAIPPTGADELRIEVARNWATLADATSREVLAALLQHVPTLHALKSRDVDEVMSAIETHRKELEAGPGIPTGNLHAPEWEVFTAAQPPPPSQDFALRRPGVDAGVRPLLADVVQAERLRMVQAFTGFTRIDAPDPTDREAVPRAPIARERPDWVPASEVRGEGIFLRRGRPPAAAGSVGCSWPRSCQA